MKVKKASYCFFHLSNFIGLMALVINLPAQRLTGSFLIKYSKRLATDKWEQLDSTDGAVFFKKEIRKDSTVYTAYLQVIDLREMKLLQITRQTGNKGLGEGKYYSEKSGNSPYFKRFSHSVVLDLQPARAGNRLFSAINGVFFEQYEDSTQLSFPVKKGGKIISWGSSLYGPVKNAADNYYNNVQLKALLIKKNSAAIVNYDIKTGYPLNNNTVPDAIVTYDYKDHPARVLANNMVNRFHVVGTLNADCKAGDEILVILTVEKTTLDNAAAQLRLLGIKSDIITIDGGTSVFVYNRKMGITEYPGKNEPQHEGEYIRIPHYIVIASKK